MDLKESLFAFDRMLHERAQSVARTKTGDNEKHAVGSITVSRCALLPQ